LRNKGDGSLEKTRDAGEFWNVGKREDVNAAFVSLDPFAHRGSTIIGFWNLEGI